MSRREVHWRLEMAAEKMKRRGMAARQAPTVDRNSEFTEEESKHLDAALEEAKRRHAERFKNQSQG